MKYALRELEDRRWTEERYIVLDKRTRTLLGDANGYGFKSPESAEKWARAQIVRRNIEGVRFDSLLVEQSEELSKETRFYEIVDEDGNVVEDFDGGGQSKAVAQATLERLEKKAAEEEERQKLLADAKEKAEKAARAREERVQRILGNANEEQKTAILRTEGPVLIIAGPGTGKTATLVKRILYLIIEKQVKPEEILVATFTEKAANELITRVTNELKRFDVAVNIKEMYIGTIHSICLRILDEYIDETEVNRHYRQMEKEAVACLITQGWNMNKFLDISRFTENFEFNNKGYKKPRIVTATDMVERIEKLEEALVDIDAMLQDSDPDVVCVAKVVLQYREILKETNVLTFQKMLTEVYHLLKDNEEIKNQIASKFRYLMIDEYQDTNYLQSQIMYMISDRKSGKHNICVVGDDDQSLYRFRGAAVANFLQFDKTEYFQDEKCFRVELKQNYRSNKDIVRFYRKWMENPKDFSWGDFTFPKELHAARDGKQPETAVAGIFEKNMAKWCEEVYRFIKNLKESGKVTDYNQIAYLSYSLADEHTTSLLDYLEQHGIPVYAPRAKRFFDRTEVMELMGCMLLCWPEYSSGLPQRAPAKKESDVKKNLPQYYLNCMGKAEKLCEKDSGLRTYIRDMVGGNKDRRIGQSVMDIAYGLFAFPSFCSYLDTELGVGVVGERAVRNVAQFMKLIAQYEDTNQYIKMSEKYRDNFLKYTIPGLFDNFIGQAYLKKTTEYEDEREYAPSGCVSFITIHQSKGMEFPVVLVGLPVKAPWNSKDELAESISENYSPNTDDEPKDMRENFDFWRKYYVAFSRAQDMLVLTAPRKPYKAFDNACKGLKAAKELNPADFEFSVVKETDIKDRYAFTSDIAVYESCPRKYKFFRGYGFPQAARESVLQGTVVHETIEYINNIAIENGNLGTFAGKAVEQWLQKDYKKLADTSHLWVENKKVSGAYEQVNRYIDRMCRVWKQLEGAEVEVSEDKGTYILEGQIDLVVKNGDGYEIVDFKSEKKPEDPENDAHVARYKRQLEVYAELLQKKTGKKVTGMRLYYMKDESTNPFIAFEKDDEQIQKTIEQFDETAKKIQDNQFDEGACDSEVCKDCEMRAYCDAQKKA